MLKQEQSGSPMGLNETDNENSSETLRVYEIAKTPFIKVGDDNGGFIALGRQKLSNEVMTNAQIKKALGTANWDLIVALVAAMIEIDKKIKEEGL